MNRRNGAAHVAEAPPSPESKSNKSRVIWTFADQGLSSLTNAALAIVVARAVTPTAFGAFGLAILTYGFVVGLIRAFVGEPFVVRFSAASEGVRRRGIAHATGAAMALGALGSAVCLIVAAVIGGVTGSAFLALAITLPGLMVQDTWRHIFFALSRPASATINDFVWTVAQFVILGLLLAGGHDSVLLVTLSWGVSGLIAAVFGYVQTGILPNPAATISWLKETKDLGVQLGIGFTLNMGAINLLTYIIGGLVGLAAVAGLRAAQTVLGPLNLVFAGFNASVLPVMSKGAAAGHRLLRTAMLSSLGLGSLAGFCVTVAVLIPDSIGSAVLKKNWEGADQLMLPAGLLLVVVALVLGASNGIVALSRTDLLLRVTVTQAPLMLILGVFGAWSSGVVAATYGMVAAQTVGLVLCWIMFIRADAEAQRRGPVIN